MIGCSDRARSRYHRVDVSQVRGSYYWAKCGPIQIGLGWPDKDEDALRLAKPHLRRCERCFGKEEGA